MIRWDETPRTLGECAERLSMLASELTYIGMGRDGDPVDTVMMITQRIEMVMFQARQIASKL